MSQKWKVRVHYAQLALLVAAWSGYGETVTIISLAQNR